MGDDSLASKARKGAASLVGMQNRLLVKIPVVGKKLAAGMSRTVGKLMPRLSFMGFRKEPSYENAIYNWENFLDQLGAEYEKEIRGPREIAYTFRKCPAGFCNSKHAEACDATMELDRNLVANSGARLRLEKTIPVDGICVEIIVPAQE